MKQFFKFMFASMLGFFLIFLIIFFVFAGIVASIGKKETVEVKPNSVLHLTLDKQIVDRASDNPFEEFNFSTFSTDQSIGLNDLITNIRKAKEDENIKGIFLDMTFVMSGWSTLREIRNELLDFKSADKFIVAYSESITQSAYYLATASDVLYINPEGLVDFRGLNANVMFIKGMLDKIGVEAQVIRYGKYKSAGEPLFRTDLSEENRTQISGYLNSLWNTALKDISESRNIPVNQLNDIADEFQTRTPQNALEVKMIDGLAYEDEVFDYIKEKLEIDQTEDINFITYGKYKNTPLPDSMLPMGSRDKIAIIYGSGNIVSGDGNTGVMGADPIAESFRKARKDSSVKVVVFRINSSGGSALASEVMLREVMLTTEVKPVIVSMGDVAASGGYYIASYADKIIANPNTITGSIGVFGVIPNARELLNDKMGITFDNVETNRFADLGSLNRPLTTAERQLIQNEIDRVYETFINHVAEGRDMPVAAVDSIAQGRVWSGVDAQRIGLVDELGGMQLAVETAAEMANLEKYRLIEYPEQKNFLEMIMEDFGSMESKIIKKRLGSSYQIYQQLQQASENTGILMRMPYDINIE
ncbi:MAG: signal peptide peptidase SppA [Bacteroidota bacterium]